MDGTNTVKGQAALGPQAAALAGKLIRNFETATLHHDRRDPLYEDHCMRLGPGTAARQLGATIEVLPPGKRACPYHLHHAEEEMFVVLEGTGTLRVAGEMLPIVRGDVIFIPAGPEYPHQIINTSDAPLKYLSISTQSDLEICEYPDSGKFGASARRDGQRVFGGRNRTEANIDYWDGEP